MVYVWVDPTQYGAPSPDSIARFLSPQIDFYCGRIVIESSLFEVADNAKHKTGNKIFNLYEDEWR